MAKSLEELTREPAPERLERFLAVIAEREPEVRAWARLTLDSARAETAAHAATSPLHGLPFGVKDIFDTAGVPTEWGTPIHAGRTPNRDAALVARLRSLGGVMLGKTHTTAYAYFDPAPTRNPHDSTRTPGGSSSGSAAAVAAGMVPFAVGSQTMGSVLRPASFCGVTGFKPTFARLPVEGAMPFAPSLDHAGLFTPTAKDMAFLWRALTGDAAFGGASGATFAAPAWPLKGKLEPEMADAFGACLERLRSAGLKIETPAPPDSFRALPDAVLTINASEAAWNHGDAYRLHGESIGAKLAALLRRGADTGETEYEPARQAVQRARSDYRAWTERYRFTLTPSALGPAPRDLTTTGDPAANAPWTALGVPAISIPMARTSDGAPLGLQISGAPHADAETIAAAVAVEHILT